MPVRSFDAGTSSFNYPGERIPPDLHNLDSALFEDFLKISQTCTDLWSAFKTHEAIIDQHIFDNCQDCFAKHCNTRFLTNHNNLSLIFISTAPYPYMVTWYEQASLLPPLSIILLMFIYSHIIVADSCCNRHYLTLLTKQPCSLTT